MDPTMIIAAILIVCVFVVLLQSKEKGKSDGGYVVNPLDREAWQMGPIIRGENLSKGMPELLSKHPEGLEIEIPYPSADIGSVHYVTMPTAPLAGKSMIRARFRLEMAEGERLVPTKFPDAPSIITLYFQRKGDDWSARGEYEAYRWYAGFANRCPVTAGEFTLEAPLIGNWGAILTSTRETNPEGFQAALNDTGRVGFVLGGGDGAGHGVYATGPARLIMLSFEII